MRPPELFRWFAEAEKIKGVGARLSGALARLGITRVRDFAFHTPTRLVDRRNKPKVADLIAGEIATIEVDIIEHQPSRGRAPARVICQDDSGFLQLIFFSARGDYLAKQLPVGEKRIISGTVDAFNGGVQMSHPDYILPPDKADEMPALECIYPSTAGISQKVLGKAVRGALSMLGDLPEWQDVGWRDKNQFPSFYTALKALHFPIDKTDIDADSLGRKRLAFDELLANQLALALVRKSTRKKAGRALSGSAEKRKSIADNLPYALTHDQAKALDEILADMASDNAMLRLVQGDVGSGKTVVAILAAAQAVAAGVQVAVLAPTEILAQQHARNFAELGAPAGLNCALLTGRVKGKARAELLANLAVGKIDVLIGTHAIIQETVEFSDLGLAIVDEQHRFGVAQRLALSEKSDNGVDVLGMTATPIPRTLTLAIYGDMDVSRIIEKPPGRTPVDTRVLAVDRLGDVVAALGRQLADGAQAYWVCPLVAESEVSDQAAAEERFKQLAQHFGDSQVGLLHGQMKGVDKEAVMARFKEGDLKLLVATTVIEVGVDVPNASIMVIEGAERFGLAQLHQLRGRVGRGANKSTCLLVRGNQLSDTGKERLRVMRESDDGFLIAEKDLQLRGSGEVLGTRQSGLPAQHFVDYSVHANLVTAARDDARLILNQDPDLKGPRGAALRVLLYLFEKDAGVRLLRSG